MTVERALFNQRELCIIGHGYFSKIISIFMVVSILMQLLVPITVFAGETRPDTIRVLTDANVAEKEALLGTTSAKARQENILGLASKFSLFTKGDITVTKADAEGRIASGGTIKSTTHPYHAGTEVKDNNVAKIIAKNGMSNMALDFTTHCYRDNFRSVIYDNTPKKAAVGTNATNMTWSEYSLYEQQQIVAADLVDFDNEFEYLQNQSDYLVGLGANGTIYEASMITDERW